MERWQHSVAVVTGASSGTGQAIAKDLVKAGLRVVALGRRQERLNENRSKLKKDEQSRFYARKCDVTCESDVKATFDWVEHNLGGVDILVNSAGIGRFGYLVDITASYMEDVLNTNVKGLIYCTQAALRSMKTRNIDGHIVHINCIAGHHVVDFGEGRGVNLFPASKFALTAINETLRNELRNLGTKIKTTSVSPGAVLTELIPKETFDEVFGKNILNPKDVSQAVLFAISTPPHVQIHEISIKAVGEKF